MSAALVKLNSAQEEFLARLTETAYRVLVHHGLLGPFVDVELDLWRRLREVVQRELHNEPPGLSRRDGTRSAGINPAARKNAGREELAWQP